MYNSLSLSKKSKICKSIEKNDISGILYKNYLFDISIPLG